MCDKASLCAKVNAGSSTADDDPGITIEMVAGVVNAIADEAKELDETATRIRQTTTGD